MARDNAVVQHATSDAAGAAADVDVAPLAIEQAAMTESSVGIIDIAPEPAGVVLGEMPELLRSEPEVGVFPSLDPGSKT